MVLRKHYISFLLYDGIPKLAILRLVDLKRLFHSPELRIISFLQILNEDFSAHIN